MLSAVTDRDERPAYVQFEQRPVEDKKASLKAGHSISKDVEFVLVTPPYSKDCFEFKVEQWFKNQNANVKNGRIPEKWLKHWKECYDAWKSGLEAPLSGTDIRNWSAISPAQIKNLRSAGCRTIEDLASANDEALKRIGMGGMDLRNKAQAYLQATKDHGPVVMENAALKNTVAQLEGTVETLQTQVRSLIAQGVAEPVEEITADDILDEKLSVLDEKTLEERYVAKFGKKPHHKMKLENIFKAVEEG